MAHALTRPVHLDDLVEVLEMVQALAAHHGDNPQLTLRDLERDCLGPMPWVTMLVAERDEVLVGYAALCPLAQVQFGARGMDMHHLYVRETERGRGVGRALTAASIQTAKALGCRYMTVGTHPDNVAAGQAYLAMAFEALPPPGPRYRIRLDV